MIFYVMIGTITDYIQYEYKKTKKDVNFIKIIKTIYLDGAFTTVRPIAPNRTVLAAMDTDTFANKIRDFYYPFDTELILSGKDYDYATPENDVTTMTQFWGIEHKPVTSQYFFINYVMSGKALFHFQNQKKTLDKGSFVIVSPPSKNYKVTPMTPNDLLIPINVLKSTFSQVFFSVLSTDDILSGFFHKLLEDPSNPNYLIFQTKENLLVDYLIRQIFLENFEYDYYTNQSNIYWLNLIFTNILRNYSSYTQFSSYGKQACYAPILKYIEYKYHTITLGQLSEKFGYTQSHLSKVIRKYTGKSFTELVMYMKLQEASRLLSETELSIEAISFKCGFHSPDHFSRMFKRHFHIAPSSYRLSINEKLYK